MPRQALATTYTSSYPPLPVLRSPYRSDDPIDGASTVAVRPYVGAC
ncbi:hypothetical protein SUDANB2_03833 [Streptomyces sp. enrichment culture]